MTSATTKTPTTTSTTKCLKCDTEGDVIIFPSDTEADVLHYCNKHYYQIYEANQKKINKQKKEKKKEIGFCI